MRGSHHWGYRHQGFRFGWALPLLAFIFIFVIGLRSGWFIFFFVFPLMWYVGKSFGNWRGEYADEKRKTDEYDADDKPKRMPTYVVGDDGELAEPEESDKKRGSDDSIYYI